MAGEITTAMMRARILGVGVSSLMIAATGGEIPQGVATAGNTSQVRIECDSVHKVGQAQKSIALAFCNYTLSGARAEVDNTNAVVLTAHIRIDSAPTTVVVLKWDGGAASHTLPIGETLAVSDEVLAAAFGLSSIAAGTVLNVRTSMTVNNTESIPTTRAKYTTGGEASVRGPSTSTQIGAAGALATPGGWAAITSKIEPVAVLGRAAASGAKSLILFGDSLVDGFKDNITYGDQGGGFYTRAAWDIGGGIPMPWSRQSKTGTTAQQAAANITKQSAIWKYATHFIDNLGTNDAGAGRTAAQTLADKRTIATAAKVTGCKAVWSRITPRASSSSDSWATVGGETITTAYQTGGTFRDPLNTSIAAEVGLSGISAVLNCDGSFADGTLNDHIGAPNFTDDGVHALPTTCANMAPAIVTQLVALT